MSWVAHRLRWKEDINTVTKSSGLIPSLAKFVKKISSSCAEMKKLQEKKNDEKEMVTRLMEEMKEMNERQRWPPSFCCDPPHRLCDMCAERRRKRNASWR